MNYEKVYSVCVDAYVRYYVMEKSAVTAKTNGTFDKMLKAWAREFARYTSYKTNWGISRDQVIHDMAKLSAIYHDVDSVFINNSKECIIIEKVNGESFIFNGTFSDFLFVSANIPGEFSWSIPKEVTSVQLAYIEKADVFDIGENKLGRAVDFIPLNSNEYCTPVVKKEDGEFYEVDYGY